MNAAQIPEDEPDWLAMKAANRAAWSAVHDDDPIGYDAALEQVRHQQIRAV